MASLKAIRKRISSVRSTQQITKAMKMVAAAKLRRAQTAAIAARPFAEKLEGMVTNLLGRVSEDAHPLLRIPEQAVGALVILVTGDRGLCGGYNANLTRTADGFVGERGGTIVFEVVGRKGADHLRRRARTVRDKHARPAAPSALGLARQIAREAERLFLEGEVASVYLIYSHFRSALSQVPQVEQVLPFKRLAPAESQPVLDYLFEPGPTEILNHLLPRMIEVRILRALLEAGASEEAARMTAMESATRNASEMIGRLTLEMNRARQAAITKELMEIIGGAEALKG
jgi:F-type H+-transporting ATPase subunit gamma